jgi:hypothetical protein
MNPLRGQFMTEAQFRTAAQRTFFHPSRVRAESHTPRARVGTNLPAAVAFSAPIPDPLPEPTSQVAMCSATTNPYPRPEIPTCAKETT